MAAPILFALLLQATPASVNPRSHELFDRDPVLKAWAIRQFDRNGDGWLTMFEAQAAADGFQDIADEDRDGRVSVREYGAAIEFIRVRY